ncbi:MAG: hypothetical protein EPO11_01000, partial [Gammaproteobacteria bacterium]
MPTIQKTKFSIEEIKELANRYDKAIEILDHKTNTLCSININDNLLATYGFSCFERIEATHSIKGKIKGRVIGVQRIDRETPMVWIHLDSNHCVSFSDSDLLSIKTIPEDGLLHPSLATNIVARLEKLYIKSTILHATTALQKMNYQQFSEIINDMAIFSPTNYLKYIENLYDQHILLTANDLKNHRELNRLFQLLQSTSQSTETYQEICVKIAQEYFNGAEYYRIPLELYKILQYSLQTTIDTTLTVNYDRNYKGLYFLIGELIFSHPEIISKNSQKSYFLALIYFTLAGHD